MDEPRTNPIWMGVILTKSQRALVNSKKSIVEIPCPHKTLLRASSIIGSLFVFETNQSLRDVLISACRLLYEKRNQKKEAKEAAAYEAFQKLKAENRHESAAVNIEQN